MRKPRGLNQLLAFVSILFVVNAAKGPTDEELEVILQFFEYDLEDICSSKNEVEWDFLTGGRTDLKQLLELELKEAELYKKERETLQSANGKTLPNKRWQRLFDIFFHPGASLLVGTELKEYKEYSVKLKEINQKMSIGCSKDLDDEDKSQQEENKDCVPKNANDVNRILSREKSKWKLKELWSEWFDELELRNRKTKFDFMQQLSILDLEAEENEEDDLADYWLKQADITHLNYHKISNLWKEIMPLYQKMRKYIATLMVENHGGKVIVDHKLIPVYLLGSLKTENWIKAAEKLGAFKYSKPYEVLKTKLNQKKVDEVFKMADNMTSDVKIGELPATFYNSSRFNVTSETCQSKVMDYCARKNTFRALSCLGEELSLRRFIEIHEEVTKLKYLTIAGREVDEDENGFLFREGPRDSVIYEAVAGLSSLIAIKPANLRKRNLLNEAELPGEEITSLLISALDIIPALPYYLAADLWRINALKEIDATVGETTYESSSTSPAYQSTTSSSENLDDSEIRKRDISEETFDGKENVIEEKGSETETAVNVENTTEVPSPSDLPVTVSTNPSVIAPKIYDFDNLTIDWWRYREQLQGISTGNEKLYADFLQDEKIIWNKPYVSKFLGKILQFQLLDYFKQENFTTNAYKIQTLLKKGKSQPYEEILSELFSITEITAKPLLNYFKPLEEFLDGGGKFSKDYKTASGSNDFNLFSQGYSMNSPPTETDKEVQKGSNTTVFAILLCAALGLISVSLFVAWRRYRRKQRAKQRRKMNAALDEI